MAFEIDAVRASVFRRWRCNDSGRRRIYLDNPAGTQVPKAVADAVARCLLETNANLGGFFATTLAARRRGRRSAPGDGRFSRREDAGGDRSSART